MKTKVLLLFIIFMLLFVTIVNAANIDMNLTNSARSTVDEDEEYQNTYYSQNDYEDADPYNENTYNYSENEEDDTNVLNTSNSQQPSSSTPSVKTTTTTSDQDFLTIENILSIALIVIGVLLILLGIAIIIRFK